MLATGGAYPIKPDFALPPVNYCQALQKPGPALTPQLDLDLGHTGTSVMMAIWAEAEALDVIFRWGCRPLMPFVAGPVGP